MNLRKSILKSLLFVCLTVPITIFSQSDTLELPFFEDWSSGSLDTNGWVADSGWVINQEYGQPEPCISLDSRILDTPIFEDLVTPHINTNEVTEGDIWVEFDVKLERHSAIRASGLEVYVRNDDGWRRKMIIWDYNGSFDWTTKKIKITNFSIGKNFQVRFTAWSYYNVNEWFIDNIRIYRECKSPTKLSIESIDTLEYDKYRLNFKWQMDEPDQGEWIHWDNGINDGGVGATYHMSVAARWDVGQLLEYDDLKLLKMKAFINEDYFDSLIFKVWEGENASNLVYYDTIHEFSENTWIEHELDSNIYVDASKELWVGYSARFMAAGSFTFGMDSGPQIDGFGNMIRFDTGPLPHEWGILSDLGIDRNWNIQFFVEDPTGNEVQIGQKPSNNRNTNLSGYNLYQSVNGGEYELLEFIPWMPGDTSHTIEFDANPDLHCYQLTAVWESESDTCESAPAISKDNPDEDFVCVLLVGNEENRIERSDLVHCYPNPFSNSTTIEYTLQQSATVQISIFNHLGKQVGLIQQNQSVGKQQITWDASGLPSGVYYFRLKAGDQVASGKMVVVR